MKETEKLTQEAKELLRPIKERPNLEPNEEFINNLRNQIQVRSSRKKLFINLKPILALCSFILILFVTVQSTNFSMPKTSGDDFFNPQFFRIWEDNYMSSIPVQTINYGNEDGQIGLKFQGLNETLPVSVVGFDVEDGEFYLLDDARKQVVIYDNEGNYRSFSINKETELHEVYGALYDILVTENKDIFILKNITKLQVDQYSYDGELIHSHDLSEVEMFSPDSLLELEDHGIVLSQNNEKFVSLETKDFIEEEDLPFYFQRLNQKENKLIVNTPGWETELTISSDLWIGNRAVQMILDEYIIISQTINPPVFADISESFLLALDKQGEIVGGANLPVEVLMVKPKRVENFIAVDGHEIYFLQPHTDNIMVSKMRLRENYTSYIHELAEHFTIGFDYQTFGRPFPELEEEIRNLFKDNPALSSYGDENSLNGAAIDDEGTVVIDFKQFLRGSPASAEKMELYTALKSVTFDKFPEIQTIYVQFDGSFSAWAYWLESTEEPWKRE